MTTLYKIDQELQLILSNADENGLFNEEEFERLSIVKKDKIEGIIKFIKHLEGTEELLDNEIERLEKLKKMNVNRKEWLTNYIANSMTIDGLKEYDFVTHKAKFKLNPPSVIIDNEEELPEEYIITKVTKSPAKSAIKVALQGGIEVKGAHLEQKEKLHII